jgi:DNA polymerase
VGPNTASLLFVGRNPGRDEDREGKPFVGASGQGPLASLLKHFEVDREEVGLINTVSCYTPSNRPPALSETLACRENLEAQLGFFPHRKVVIALGNEALQFVSPSDRLLGITLVEGRPLESDKAPLALAIRHPSFFLRNRDAARQFGTFQLPEIKKLVKETLENGRSYSESTA